MGEKERRLTAAEQRRKENFEALKARLEGKGYQTKLLTIGAVKANFLAVVLMLPFIILLAGGYLWANKTFGNRLSLPELLMMLAILLILFAAHELIHGLVWSRFTKNGFKSIEFGIVWSALAPYCTCAEPMKRRQYALGLTMPTLVLGFGLGIAAIFMGQSLLLYLSLLMTLGGGGDFCILLKLLCYHPKGEAIYCDHPYELGLAVFEKNAA